MSDSSTPNRLGYARVSTVGQTLEAQLDQLKAAGCSRVWREKVSGAKVDRKELGKLIKSITDGDQVVVTRIDRLARSTFELFAFRQKDHRRGRSIPKPRGAVGRYIDQHGTLDDRRSRRAGRRGARLDPHSAPAKAAPARSSSGSTWGDR
mgnify:CR=1 FL=1